MSRKSDSVVINRDTQLGALFFREGQHTDGRTMQLLREVSIRTLCRDLVTVVRRQRPRPCTVLAASHQRIERTGCRSERFIDVVPVYLPIN